MSNERLATEKISMALARLGRIKILMESWCVKKSISNIERNIVLNQLATLYDELTDGDICQAKPVSNILSNTVMAKAPNDEPELGDGQENISVKQQDKPILAEKTILVEENEPVIAIAAVQAEPTIQPDAVNTTVRLGDKFVGVHKYLFENFENQDDSGFARFSTIDDINRAIGINDRFLFIKELFNGDKELFNKTISALNDCSSLDDALMYLHDNFSWNSEDSTVKQLVLLLYRRFKQ